MPRPGRMLLAYALTMFVSALLLFLVEPLIGKLIVPLLGGFPSVWNACLFFFQAMLLAGYAYAHYSAGWLGTRKHALLHIGLLALVAVPVLLFHLEVFRGLVPSSDDNLFQLVFGVLLLLTVSAGLPFFAVSTTASLLQRWFASTAHPDAKDPYFLYAASNAGSMLALFCYPIAIEPQMTLVQQRWAWSIGYAVLVLLIGACAWLLLKAPPALELKSLPAGEAALPKEKEPAPEPATAYARFRRFAHDFVGPSLAEPVTTTPDDDITFGQAARWVALAFVPSSLMLGVTTYITTDIASIPLLWVIPLALYLLSFIIVFSKSAEQILKYGVLLPGGTVIAFWAPIRAARMVMYVRNLKGQIGHRLMVLALPVLMLLLVFMMVSRMKAQLPALILLHLVVLFAVALVCHGELARTRPPARHLTMFFLLVSVGGVLGGLFNALLAPVLFKSLAEYQMALVCAAFLIPRLDDSKGPASLRSRVLDFALPAVLLAVALEFFGTHSGSSFPVTNDLLARIDRLRELPAGTTADGIVHVLRSPMLRGILQYAPPIILCYLFVERPLRFGLGVAALLFASVVPVVFNTDREVIYRDRSFFGVMYVKEREELLNDEVVKRHTLMHGNILHGMQYLCPELRGRPVTYYYSSGPIGQTFAALGDDAPPRDVAVIGLGTGTMAAYARSGDHYTFYEIDRQVKALSFDQDGYFSYVQDAKKRGAEVDIVLGDARLSMDRERQTDPGRKYDLIVVDAFSSDAIPVHLMTREALRIFRDRLKDNGIIIFHTSNRYLTKLDQVVGNLAVAEGMVALTQHDYDDDAKKYPGKTVSNWVLVANKDADFGKLLDDIKTRPEDAKHWERLKERPELGVWTDDFSNLLSIFDWGGE